MTLFTAQELQSWLQYDVEDDSANLAERVVAGWLSNATGLVQFPDPLPPQLFSWAIELGGIAYENPTSQSDDQAQNVRTAWMDRRSQILREARTWSQNPTGSGPATHAAGGFPAAVPLPDPAVLRPVGWVGGWAGYPYGSSWPST